MLFACLWWLLAADPTWVSSAPDGRLSYQATPAGDQIPDFSYCGYAGGGVAPPVVPVVLTVDPAAGDATARLQAALDELAARPPAADGWRGALLLRRGRYEISGQLHLRAGGCVLRGEGSGADGTVVVGTSTRPQPLLVVAGEGEPVRLDSSRQPLLGERVPLGARTLRVADTAAYRVGDTVQVQRPSTAEWIQELGMDRIPPKSGLDQVVQWQPGRYDLFFDRRVTAVGPGEVTLDAPLGTAFEARWGGGQLWKTQVRGRIRQVGVEHLRGDSRYTSPTDEAHADWLVRFDSCEDAWLRDVVATHFTQGCVTVGRRARAVTVVDCASEDPISQITGGRRYPFNLDGQLVLFLRCRSREARHDFVTGSTVAGPNAFVDCRAERCHSDTGPHQRWATATLYDNVVAKQINVQNRGNSGTGHGWAGAWHVLYRCTAESMVVSQPPTAANWAIGCQAARLRGDAWQQAADAGQPRSLYFAQLAERLGAAVAARVEARP
ncbi:MAG: hypothetical protein IT204_03530 [Fimbriimonadaceae bacterium]|nr:hypothetical protein [Fimbriimonadaceae bacterium]